MVMKGIKESVPSTVPLAVIGDLDILVAAPKRLLQAGFGDILAKYTSICVSGESQSGQRRVLL